MSWVKIDDHANEHRKQAAAGPAACWLWVCGLMWCNRQERRTGVIPSAVVPILFPGATRKLAERLVEVELWEAEPGGYRVHNYFEFQPKPEEVEERRKKRAMAGQLGGARSGEARRQASSKQVASHVASTPKQRVEANREAKPNPDPDPDPVPEEIPPTPHGGVLGVVPEPTQTSVRASSESQRAGFFGVELEDYRRGVEAGTGRRCASFDAREAKHTAKAIEAHCPAGVRGHGDEAVLAWLRATAERYASVHEAAGKAEFQRGYAPAKFVEWLNAGAKDPAASGRFPTAEPSPAPYHRPWHPDGEEPGGRGAA